MLSLLTNIVYFVLVEADGIAPNESPPNQVLEEVFENERLQPFRVRQ